MSAACGIRDAVLAFFLANPFETLSLADCCVKFDAAEPDVVVALQQLLVEGQLVWGKDTDDCLGPVVYRLPASTLLLPKERRPERKPCALGEHIATRVQNRAARTGRPS